MRVRIGFLFLAVAAVAVLLWSATVPASARQGTTRCKNFGRVQIQDYHPYFMYRDVTVRGMSCVKGRHIINEFSKGTPPARFSCQDPVYNGTSYYRNVCSSRSTGEIQKVRWKTIPV